MATSGSTTGQLTRNQIIEAAMRKIQALAKGQTPDSEDYTNAQVALNSLIPQYQTLGMHLWKRKEYTLPLTASQSSYTIGIAQTIDTVFPLKLKQVILVNTNSDSQIDVGILSVYNYNLLPISQDSGPPVNVTYQPFVNYGVLKVWPTPDTTTVANYTLKLVYEAPIEKFTASTENPDFPQEWELPLIYGLAMLLAPEFGLPIEDRRELEKQHEKYLQTALEFGAENASMFFQPDNMRRQ